MLKRAASFILAVICAFTFLFICPVTFKTEAASYFTGSGTVADPYQISSKSDLKKLAELCNTADANTDYKIAYYIQTADIDLGNEAWTPIGKHWDSSTHWGGNRVFGGVYDGKGHTISGLNVSGAYPYAGLFGGIGTSMKSSSRVENLIVKGNVSPTIDTTFQDPATWIGGIAGEIGEGASITNCSFIGTVSGLNSKGVVGGIVGKIYFTGNVINCSFNGTLKNTENNSVAGIVANIGEKGSDVTIQNCYATGTMDTNGSSYGAGIAAQTGYSDYGSTVYLINCYYTSDFCNVGRREDCMVTTDDTHKLSASNMKSTAADRLGEAFVSDTAHINNGYPIHLYQSYSLKGLGTEANPYQISSKEDLFYMSDAVNARIGYYSYYVQTADIDLENENFIPIGTYTEYNRGYGPGLGFEGNYDGNCKNIYNLNVNRTGEKQTYSGLFGWMYAIEGPSIVKNLVVHGMIKCLSGGNVGGIVGEVGSYMVTIENCAFIGDVTGKTATGGIVGGIWYGSANINIKNCYFNGNVTSTDPDVCTGGIVGRVSKGGDTQLIISNCYAVGTFKNNSSNSTKVGSISGALSDDTSSTNFITSNCYYLSSSPNQAVNQTTYTGCIPLSEKELRSGADKLNSPFVNNNNENLNDGYPVFEWQTSSVDVKQNVSSGFKGSGTESNPYQISSVKDLKRLSELINDESTNPLFRYAYYIQTNDIDMTGEDFTPIGIYIGVDGNTTSNAVFAGNYNGDYHSITNLSISYSNDYCGLFGRVGEYNYDNSNCEIKNLSVAEAVECYSESGKVGGIVGELAYGATVRNCDFHGIVTADGKTGGVAGLIYCGGTVTACYSDAEVTTSSSDSSTGGIIGEISVGKNDAVGSSNAIVERTYYNGALTVSNTSATGAICGKVAENGDKTVSFNTNFFLSSSYSGGVENASASGCTKFSSVALKACADMLGSPYVENNDTKLNNGYPVFEWQSKPYDFLGDGTASNPYQISSKEELEEMRNLVNSDYFNTTYGHAYYIQTADIDLENESWTPVGIGYNKNGEFNEAKVFYGNYDGNHKYINNLNADDTSLEAGLFGIVDGVESAKISNVVVYGTVISDTASHAGGIVGKMINNAMIDGCGFVGEVNVTTSGDNIISAGGIVGIIADGGTITNCYHNGEVSSSQNAGGILGTAEFTHSNTVTIENCYQTNGIVSGTDSASSIVGNCIYADSAEASVNINNCYCTNDTGTNESSQNATTDNTLILSKSLLKKAAEDLGDYYTLNTDSTLNDGYPVFQWELFTSTLRGDVNGDGVFSLSDIVCLQRWLLADKRAVINCWENGDLVEDDKLNAFDLCLMKRKLIQQ